MYKRLLTITPNPSLDISGFAKTIKPNEKTYVSNEITSAGGNAINVARMLTRWRIPVIATGFIGGRIGEEVNDLLLQEKVLCDFVNIKGSTRVNVTVSLMKDHRHTRFSFPGPKITDSDVKRLQKVIQRNGPELLVIGGSLPPGFTIKHLNNLIHIAVKNHVDVVIDCPGKILRELRSPKVLLLKPNLEEFQEMTGSHVRSIAAVKKRAQEFLKFASYVCVSSVEGGALLITKQGAFFGKTAPIKIKSTVGAGDSMVAAMVAKISAGVTSEEEILRWGLAAAAATLSEPGTELGHISKFRSLFLRTKVFAV
ncbi:1-phosphofructokinase family hexose kinase [Bdellovibrio sp. NC01]|uniref:1-phosphofructokinase family hexose kinase n=1 Tax=Bdellovibrio sp. NC01 TaxID=2220073 RepID=UPI0011579A98|nr:hexose kinase [Bdellovibrio sp. NC01]QDK36463.1 hypothetical protein DOE51_02035 [Bdellovibrio sp. NC01]